jgi:hypothetical protein
MTTRVVIVMDGGLIQHILSNSADVEIAMIDYDVESVEEDRLTDIPQTDGEAEKAYCWVQVQADEINAARVDELFEAISRVVQK